MIAGANACAVLCGNQDIKRNTIISSDPATDA